jgi:hypothetical protein
MVWQDLDNLWATCVMDKLLFKLLANFEYN